MNEWMNEEEWKKNERRERKISEVKKNPFRWHGNHIYARYNNKLLNESSDCALDARPMETETKCS